MSEAQDVKRSIFKQRICARRYKLEYRSFTENIYPYRENHHIGLGTSRCDEVIAEETICELAIKMPLLKKGERFYIEEKDMLVEVVNSYRTSKDAVVYYVQPKLVDDEYTDVSLAECKNDIWNRQQDKINELTKEINNIKSKWYDRSFNKFSK